MKIKLLALALVAIFLSSSCGVYSQDTINRAAYETGYYLGGKLFQ